MPGCSGPWMPVEQEDRRSRSATTNMHHRMVYRDILGHESLKHTSIIARHRREGQHAGAESCHRKESLFSGRRFES